MTEKTYVVVEINKDKETHRFPCEVVKLNESTQTADVKFKDGIVYNNVPYELITEGIGDLWNKIKSGAKAIGAKFKEVGGAIVAFVNGAIANAIGPLQAAFNFQKGRLPKGIVVIPSDETIEAASAEGIKISKNIDKVDENEDDDYFIQSLNDFWSLIKEEHEAKGGEVSESDMNAIYWKVLSARRNMQLNEGLLKPADIIMPLSVKQEQIDLINTGVINEGYLYEMEDFDSLFGVKPAELKKRPGSGNDDVPIQTLNKLKAKKWSEVPNVYYDELVNRLRRDMMARLSTSFEDELNGALDGTRPILIWGAPAIGKTSIINQLIKNEMPTENLNMYSVTASMLYRDDFMLPLTTNLEARDVPKSWLPCFHKTPCEKGMEVETWSPLNDIANGINEGHNGGIIFVDEFSRVTTEAMTVFMTLVQSREINSEFRIGSKWMFVMAANRPEDMEGGEYVQAGQTFSWDPAWSGRFEHVNYVPEFDNWVAWAERKGMEKVLLDFIKSNPKYWFDSLDHASSSNSLDDDLSTTGVQMLRSDQRGIADADNAIKSERKSKRMEGAAQEMVREFKDKAAQEFVARRKQEGASFDPAAAQAEIMSSIPWKSKSLDWKQISTNEIINWLNNASDDQIKMLDNIDLTSDEFTDRVKSHMGTTAARDFGGYMRFYRYFPEEYAKMVWEKPEAVPLDNPSVTLTSNILPMVNAIAENKPEPKNAMTPEQFKNVVIFALRLHKIQPTALNVFITQFFGKNSEQINNYLFKRPEDGAAVSMQERLKLIAKEYAEGIKLLELDRSSAEASATLKALLSTNMGDVAKNIADKEEAKRNKKK